MRVPNRGSFLIEEPNRPGGRRRGREFSPDYRNAGAYWRNGKNVPAQPRYRKRAYTTKHANIPANPTVGVNTFLLMQEIGSPTILAHRGSSGQYHGS